MEPDIDIATWDADSERMAQDRQIDAEDEA